jgi:hypothetical protein
MALTLLPEPTLNPRPLGVSFKIVGVHPVKVFRSNVTPTAGMIQQLPCGKVDCEDGCWESKQTRKGQGLAMAIAEGSAMAREGVQVLEGDKRAWKRVKDGFRYDGMRETFGVKFPRTVDGHDGFTLIMVSRWDLGQRAGLTKVAEIPLFGPYARTRKVEIADKSRSEGFFDFRKLSNLVDTRSSDFRALEDLTVAFSLAQSRNVRSEGRAAYVAGINRFTANPERRFCRGGDGVHDPAWVWNAQVKRGEVRVCRWCDGIPSSPWRALKSGTRVREMADALSALRPFGARGRDDSTFCYFHILPGQSDLEIENALALYGSGLGRSFHVTHSEPTILDAISTTV